MVKTLSVLTAVCAMSLAYIFVIPCFARTKRLMRFPPQDMNAADEMSAMNRDFKRVLAGYGTIPEAWTFLERGTNGYPEEWSP